MHVFDAKFANNGFFQVTILNLFVQTLHLQLVATKILKQNFSITVSLQL